MKLLLATKLEKRGIPRLLESRTTAGETVRRTPQLPQPMQTDSARFPTVGAVALDTAAEATGSFEVVEAAVEEDVVAEMASSAAAEVGNRSRRRATGKRRRRGPAAQLRSGGRRRQGLWCFLSPSPRRACEIRVWEDLGGLGA